MKIVVLETALDDLEDGFLFYERQAPGLGNYFLDTLWADIDSLQIYAGIQVELSGYYRLLSKRFPYAVYYKVEGDEICVRAVLDCRQNPRRTNHRLR